MKSTKIISTLTLIAILASLIQPNQARGTDFTPSSESYQSTPATHANSLSNYQTTALNSGNYTSVGTNDSDYLTTTASGGQNYVEDVFSTYTYTGNGSTQTINNGIDLQNNDGMVWTKARNQSYSNTILDTVRGTTKQLYADLTDAQSVNPSSINAVSVTGYTMGAATIINGLSTNFSSWTFREAPKFFDIVTYTGDGTSNRQIAHDLGISPGMVITKPYTSGATGWMVYHRNMTSGTTMELQSASAAYAQNNISNFTESTFNVSSNSNVNEQSYVAYVFAHDSSEDGLIQCGNYTGNGSATGPSVSLGWEPQWLLAKRASGGTADWTLVDSMRRFDVSTRGVGLYPNLSNSESVASAYEPTASGFNVTTATADWNASGSSYIYCAIRKGPMKTPTDGTKVYNAIARTGTNVAESITGVGFAPDSIFSQVRNGAGRYGNFDRLRGKLLALRTASTGEELSYVDSLNSFDVNGYTIGSDTGDTINSNGYNFINWIFRRAPGFFDQVAYTGTGSQMNVAHNLGVTPELVIVKSRNNAQHWRVGGSVFSDPTQNYMMLNMTNAKADANMWGYTAPTANQFTVYGPTSLSEPGTTYTAYLYATLPGISKVGSYTGDGTSGKTINAGFTGGAKYIMIKRTDSTGDWIVWDATRGIVAGNDPHISLNTTSAEVTSDDSVDPDNSGFQVNQNTATNINVNGANYIYYAVSGDTTGTPPTSGAATYASQLYSFDATSFTNYGKLEISLLSYATAAAGDGITAKIWNNTTSEWDTLSGLSNTNSSMPTSLATQSITTNVNDYFNNNKVKVLITSTNPSTETENSILNTDFIKIGVTGLPAITTNTITNITSNSATGNADLTNTNGENPERFIQWSTISNSYNETDQCTAGTGTTGIYQCNLTNLTPNTTYYYRAKATNSSGTGYGTELSFATSIGSPVITTNATTNITSIGAQGNANITNTNGENPTARQIEWGTTSETYTHSCNAGTGATGTYQCNLTNLTPNTTYYYRAKATNTGGTSYGTELSFTTLPEEITIVEPDETDMIEANSSNYFTIADGTTLTETTQATTNLNLKMTNAIGEITLPVGTAITNTDSGNIDMSKFTIRNVSTQTRNIISTSRGAIEIGIPNTRLTFSNHPITVSIQIDPVYNGELLSIQSQSYGQSTWTDEGTCTVTNGQCTFTTTHATTYTVNGDGTLSGRTTVDTNLPINATIALACDDEVNLNNITGTGQSSLTTNNEITCNIKTNNSTGYKLEWQASGTDLANANADTISPYSPATPNTPETWNIDQANSAWGARLKSTSTDKNTNFWGATDDYATGKWLNVNSSNFQIIQRTTETVQLGSDEIIQFGAEVGSNKFQPSGSYTTDVIFTATTL